MIKKKRKSKDNGGKEEIFCVLGKKYHFGIRVRGKNIIFWAIYTTPLREGKFRTWP